MLLQSGRYPHAMQIREKKGSSTSGSSTKLDSSSYRHAVRSVAYLGGTPTPCRTPIVKAPRPRYPRSRRDDTRNAGGLAGLTNGYETNHGRHRHVSKSFT